MLRTINWWSSELLTFSVAKLAPFLDPADTLLIGGKFESIIYAIAACLKRGLGFSLGPGIWKLEFAIRGPSFPFYEGRDPTNKTEYTEKSI